MITSIYVSDPQGINTVELDTLVYPLQAFSWEYPMVGDSLNKPFSAGRWDTRKSVNYMTINCEGEILANTTALYWTARKALLACVLPLQLQDPNFYNHSILTLALDDGTEYFAEVTLSSYSIPLTTTGSPTCSPFQFSWECNVGYWLAAGSAEAARI